MYVIYGTECHRSISGLAAALLVARRDKADASSATRKRSAARSAASRRRVISLSMLHMNTARYMTLHNNEYHHMYLAAVLRSSAGLPCIFEECWLSPCLVLNIRVQLGHGMVEVPGVGRRGISVKGNKKYIKFRRYVTLGNAVHKLCWRSMHDGVLHGYFTGTSDCQ